MIISDSSFSITVNSGSNDGILSFNLTYPDPIEGFEAVTIKSQSYQVPSGKNLHITNIYHDTNYLINGKRIINNPGSNGYYGNSELYDVITLAGNSIIEVDVTPGYEGEVEFSGYLVNASVEPIILDLSFQTYEVPVGKTFVIQGLSLIHI